MIDQEQTATLSPGHLPSAVAEEAPVLQEESLSSGAWLVELVLTAAVADPAWAEGPEVAAALDWLKFDLV